MFRPAYKNKKTNKGKIIFFRLLNYFITKKLKGYKHAMTKRWILKRHLNEILGYFLKKKQKIKIPSSDWEKKGGKWGIQLPHVVFIENNKNSKIIKYYNQDQTKDFLVNAIYY